MKNFIEIIYNDLMEVWYNKNTKSLYIKILPGLDILYNFNLLMDFKYHLTRNLSKLNLHFEIYI